MIRADRVTKAYANMKPEELAAIAFQFLADTNEKELDSVRRAVPWKSYKALDYDFRTRYDSLFNMASYFAIEFWKGQAMLLAAIAQARESIGDKDFEASDKALDAVASYRIRLVSLSRAGEIVCQELGIDPATLWKVAGAERPPMTGDPSPVWLTDYTAYLRAMATGAEMPELVSQVWNGTP
jgi:hypothetical protein